MATMRSQWQRLAMVKQKPLSLDAHLFPASPLKRGASGAGAESTPLALDG